MALHIVGLAGGGRVYHTIRDIQQPKPWTPWDDVTAKVGSPPGALVTFRCATVAGTLHICGVTANNRIVHTFRDTIGTWQPFWGDVGTAAELGNARPDFVAATGAGGDLHVFATVQPENTGPLLASDWSIRHAIRRTAPPSWPQPFTYVTPSLSGSLLYFADLGAATVQNALHVCVVGLLNNQLWHTMRAVSGGTWQTFNDVRLVHGNKIGNIGMVAMAGIGSSLHVCVTVGGSVWHTIRYPTSWQPQWGDVRAVMDPPFTAQITHVACAVVAGNLHVTARTESGRIVHTIRMTTPSSWQNPEGSGQAIFGDVTDVVGALGVDPRPFVYVATSGDG